MKRVNQLFQLIIFWVIYFALGTLWASWFYDHEPDYHSLLDMAHVVAWVVLMWLYVALWVGTWLAYLFVTIFGLFVIGATGVWLSEKHSEKAKKLVTELRIIWRGMFRWRR